MIISLPTSGLRVKSSWQNARSLSGARDRDSAFDCVFVDYAQF
jgi:hypothetical protein